LRILTSLVSMGSDWLKGIIIWLRMTGHFFVFAWLNLTDGYFQCLACMSRFDRGCNVGNLLGMLVD
jgi:hypothetical protein